MNESNDAQVVARYKGIRGWLLLFCLNLTAFTPLLTILERVSGYHTGRPYFDHIPGLLAVTIIDGLLSIGLAAFSMYTGFSLWRIQPRAVVIAKKYLLVFLGFSIFAIFLRSLIDFPSEAKEALILQSSKEVFGAFVYFAVWYSYLNRSKRVKATYEKLD